MDNVDYAYKGYMPYGAGDLFCIDQWLPDDFSGNAIEYLLAQGFTLKEDPILEGVNLVSPIKGEAIARLVKR